MATATTSKKKTKTEVKDDEAKPTSLIGSIFGGLWYMAVTTATMLYNAVSSAFGLKIDPLAPQVKTTYWQYVATAVFVVTCLVITGYAFPWQFGLAAVTGIVLVLEVPYLAALSVEFKSKANRRRVYKSTVLACVLFLLGVVTVEYPVAGSLGMVFWVTWLSLDKLLGDNVASRLYHKEEEERWATEEVEYARHLDDDADDE